MDTQVPAAAVAGNALLELGTCPLHDRPGVRTTQRTFYTATPLWTLLLVVVSLLIGLIVMLVIRKEVKGKVAECERCVSGQRQFRYTTIAAWVLVVGLLLALAGSSNGAVFLLWFLAMIGALVYSFSGNRSRVTGVLSKDRLWVKLKKVEPTFATKLEGRMATASG